MTPMGKLAPHEHQWLLTAEFSEKIRRERRANLSSVALPSDFTLLLALLFSAPSADFLSELGG